MKKLFAPLVVAVLSSVTPNAFAQAASEPSVETCLADHVAAQERKLDGRLLEARNRLRSCAQSTCPGPVAQECRQMLSEVEPRISSIVPIVRDVEGRDIVEGNLALDGEVIPAATWGRPREVDPGAHELMLTQDQRVVARMKIVVVEGEKSRRIEMRVETSQDARAGQGTSGLRIAGIVGAGLGLGALIGGGVVGGLARAEYGDLETSCAPQCSETAVSSVRQKALVTDVLLGTGIVLGVTGVLMIALPGKKNADVQSRSAWVPMVFPTERGFMAGVVGQWF